ncbi:transcription initiation factor TFIID subunit 3-like [Oncorhynchus nerka]|uniref:transcription initiation factor TFIID subunit 3-like n=1 Tax=Oncorhynchus nerka TaxID=8023 RepID=UPI0031B88D74
MVQEEPLHIQNPTAGSGGGVGAAQLFVKYCADDLPLGLGPYVNPNDVQASNGALPGSPCLVETKLHDQSDSQKHDSAEVRKDAGIKKAAQQHLPNSKVPTTNNPAKKQQPKLKLSALSSAKNKHLLAGKGPKGTQQHALGKKLHQRGNMHKMDEMKAKQVIVSLKSRDYLTWPRRSGQKHCLESVLPGMSPGRRLQPNRLTHVADTQPQPQFGWTPCKRANPQKETSEEEKEEEQDEPKVKKPDKSLQKQRSRNVSRSISVEEPQLFIPDNAPAVVKKETSEEEQAKESGKGPDKEPANSETVVWDPNKNCGLCNKPHSNKFMVGCGHCDDWFHGDCVGLDLAKVKQMEGGGTRSMSVCSAVPRTSTPPPRSQAVLCRGEARAEGQQKPSETQDNKMAAKQKQPSPHPVTSGESGPSERTLWKEDSRLK